MCNKNVTSNILTQDAVLVYRRSVYMEEQKPAEVVNQNERVFN